MILFPRFSCLVLFWGHATFQDKTNNKMATIFLSSLQTEMLKLGRQLALWLQTQRLREDNYSSCVQQFLLAQCVCCALATYQIARYINGPIELAVVCLRVHSRWIWARGAYKVKYLSDQQQKEMTEQTLKVEEAYKGKDTPPVLWMWLALFILEVTFLYMKHLDKFWQTFVVHLVMSL